LGRRWLVMSSRQTTPDDRQPEAPSSVHLVAAGQAGARRRL
jgi:hypothetical protein